MAITKEIIEERKSVLQNDINSTKLKLGEEWTVSPTKELRADLTAELGSHNFQFISH